MDFLTKNLIKKELEFYYKNPIIFIPPKTKTNNSIIKNWNFTIVFDIIMNLIEKNQKFTLRTHTEILRNDDYLEKIIDLIDNSSLDIKISFATSTQFKYSYHPLVNLNIHWFKQQMRESISWETNQPYIKVFDINYFKNITKSNKGIISVRKEIDWRTHLFNQLNVNNFDGIFRYSKWIFNPNDENIDFIKNKNNFPSYLELLDEYKKSYVSFVVESDSECSNLNSLTEKTLIPFLTKSIPIVLGGKNYVKELKEMGFYVWNDEFGFYEDDSDSIFDRVDNFVKCIEYFNTMSKEDIKNLYIDNFNKINDNYKLASEYIFKRFNSI